MGDTSTFVIAFIFNQQSGTSGLAGSLSIQGSNSFVLGSGTQVQILPYIVPATPPLINFSLSPQALQFACPANSGGGRQCLEVVATVTAIGSALGVTVNNADPYAEPVQYSFIGHGASGSLNLGSNSIPFPTA